MPDFAYLRNWTGKIKTCFIPISPHKRGKLFINQGSVPIEKTLLTDRIETIGIHNQNNRVKLGTGTVWRDAYIALYVPHIPPI